VKPVNKSNSIGQVLLLLLIMVNVSCKPDPGGIALTCLTPELTAYQGEKVTLRLEAVNHMKETVRPGNSYFISYHLYDTHGNPAAYENRRFPLPRILRRNKATTFDLPVYFDYTRSGEYTAEIDIVKEGKFWGSAKKWQTCRVKLYLKPLLSDEFKKNYLPYFIATGNPLLDQEQYLLRITLKNSEIRDRNGDIYGFSAGSAYPQVWIRDTATLVAYAKRVYPFKTIAQGIELFLEHQGPDGEIVDWVDIDGNTGKNTVETDQESSLVLAALELGKDNPQWLTRVIKGKTIIQRLDMALEWVWRHKRHQTYNLILSGFTADWGDTEKSYPDQRATRLSDRSTMVLGIYTNAKFLRAANALAACNPPEKSIDFKRWLERGQLIRLQVNKQLYLADEGYFIAHIVPDAPMADRERYFQMEKKMLAVGGNAEAILAGLMDRRQADRFFDEFKKRRETYNLDSASFVLIPPYPEGFFPHHLLKRPWSYQNGGQWDWIGARLVKALFLYQRPQQAESYLVEIARKNLSRFLINEWEDRGGNPQGADFYVGAAGQIAEAIIAGYEK